MTRVTLLLLLLALAAPPAEIRRATRDPDNLVAHEWGTFTTVAGEKGEQVLWHPLSGADDLPCFVDRFRLNTKGTIAGTVRMETPVLYFYAPRATTVDVSVRFPSGLITEWYPRAEVTPASSPIPLVLKPGGTAATAVWTGVKVQPGAAERFPTEAAASHYYPARRTDAAPLQVGQQAEKFLFYRGVAVARVPVAAKVSADGRAVVTAEGSSPLGTIVRFDRRNGKVGYEIQRVSGSTAALAAPALSGDIDALGRELEKILTSEGLYAREARAMVDTWRDSWFEEGTRVLYVLPRPAVDAMLPLDIRPRPAGIARVFVGRIELFTAATIAEVRTALENRDADTLLKYGRFLAPIALRILGTPGHGLDPAGVPQFAYGTLARLGRTASCAPGTGR